MIRLRVGALLVVALAVSACSDKTAVPEAGATLSRPPAQRVLDAVPKAKAERLLSYTHHLQISVPGAQLEPALKALQAACQAVPEQGCIVMQLGLYGRNMEGASINMKVQRTSVDAFRTQANSLGKLLSWNTNAEDVSGPMTDATRRLAMSKALREDLLELRKQSRGNIDALIKATEKLAEVQAVIEATEGDLATLNRRVAMDDLSVDLVSADASRIDHHPVSDAVSRFVDNLANGLGALVTFLALALPWMLLIASLPFVWRGLRRIWKLGRR